MTIETCTTCGSSTSVPKKRIVRGVIIEQCVDRCHDIDVMARAPSNTANFLADAKRRFRRAGLVRY